MITSVYSSFDELYIHIENNALADFVHTWADDLTEFADDEFCGDGENFYAFCMALLTGHINKNNMVLCDKIDLGYTRTACMALLSAYNSDPKEGDLVINNIMHIMHSIDLELRESATEQFAEFIMPYLGYEGYYVTAYPSYDGIVLTGKDAVPDEWETQIKKVAENYGAYVMCRMSWLNSHLDRGSSYMYDEPESINAYVYADSITAVHNAEEAINKLHFHWEN